MNNSFNLLSALSVFKNIIKVLKENWVGLLIGFAIGFLILFIVFLATKRTMNWFVAIVLILVCGFAGLGINVLFNDNKSTGYEYIANTKIVDPTSIIDIVSNGGFDRSYIDEHENDVNCPTASDKYFEISCVDYKDCCVFFYERTIGSREYVVNSIMWKTNNGLVFDGCFNIRVKDSGVLFWKKYTFVNEMYKGDNFSNYANFNPIADIFIRSEVIYYSQHTTFYSDFVLGVRWFECFRFVDAGVDMINETKIKNVCEVGTYNVFRDYFQQLGNLGIKCSSDKTAYSDMNTFYNSVYESVSANGCDSVVNVTALVGDVQKVDNQWVVYKSNRYLNVEYIDHSNYDSFGFHKKQSNALDLYDDKAGTDVSIISVSNPIVKVLCVNEHNRSLTNLDLTLNPVQIEFTNISTNNKYYYTFNNISDLNLGLSRALPFGNYNYRIVSNVLDFGGNTGNIVVDIDHREFTFNYDYNQNNVNVKISLSPVANVDLTDFSISDSPVTITLSNDADIYTFTFSNSQSMTNGITKTMLAGTYEYTITSDDLSFALPTGVIVVNLNTRNFVFNYDYYVLNDLIIADRISSHSDVVDDSVCIFAEDSYSSYLDDFASIDTIEIRVIDKTTMLQYTYSTLTNDSHMTWLSFAVNDFDVEHEYALQVIFTYVDINDETIRSSSNISNTLTLQSNGRVNFLHVDLYPVYHVSID